jgi:hypothetical protein
MSDPCQTPARHAIAGTTAGDLPALIRELGGIVADSGQHARDRIGGRPTGMVETLDQS